MTTVATNKKSTRLPVVSSGDTDTGHFLRAQAYSNSSFALVGVGINIIALILNAVGLLSGVEHFAGNLVFPTFGLIASSMGNTFHVIGVRTRIKSYLSVTDNEIFIQTRKSIDTKTKLAMLFRRPIRDTLLLSESDKYSMTNTQARLVQRAGEYYIEVETVDALKTWDAALEAVVPATISRPVLDTAVKKQAEMLEYSIQKARFEQQARLLEEEMLWIHARQMDADHRKKLDAIYSLCGDDNCHGCAEDYDVF